MLSEVSHMLIHSIELACNRFYALVELELNMFASYLLICWDFTYLPRLPAREKQSRGLDVERGLWSSVVPRRDNSICRPFY